MTAAQALLSAVCWGASIYRAPLVFDSNTGRALIEMLQKCRLLFGSHGSLTPLLFSLFVFLSVCFLLPSVSYFLFVFSCSAPLSHRVFSFRLYICPLLAFHLCKLDDTTFSWTWLALSQLSYGLLFHEHRHYFSSLLLSLSFLAHMLFAAAVTKIDVQFNDSSYWGV